jgi:hypothetical protein
MNAVTFVLIKNQPLFLCYVPAFYLFFPTSFNSQRTYQSFTMNCEFVFMLPCARKSLMWSRTCVILEAAESSSAKRSHSGSPVATTRKRPRAIEIPQPLRAAPASWAMLSQRMNHTWKYSAALAKVISDGAESMQSEDLSSRIVTESEYPTVRPT